LEKTKSRTALTNIDRTQNKIKIENIPRGKTGHDEENQLQEAKGKWRERS
jgi:hypothetical protein